MKQLIIIITLLLWANPLLSLGDKGYEKLDIFTRILKHVERDYVESVDEEKILDGAIRGLLYSLDPHSMYMPPEVYRDLKVDTRGVFGGVGIEVTVKERWLTIVSPIEGTPADKAGLQPKDRILRIDGKITKDWSLSQAVQKMRGRVNTPVELTIGREGVEEPFEVKITRKIIRVPNIKYELIDKKYAYVRVSSFQERTVTELRKILKRLQRKNQIAGLILDLRNNPGGLLEEAVGVTDLFLKKGIVVTTSSRGKEVDRREAHDDGTEGAYPIIVLVNGGSASASEIVAGALQDNERAIVLGTRTFGKGSVQSVIELEDGSALKLTVARYYTPSGRSIQAEGIIPDIAVEQMTLKQLKEGRKHLRIREENLKGHLTSGQTPKLSADENFLKSDDYQKNVAIHYLQSWGVFQKVDE